MGSLHSNKFLNPIRDGAVLPILHLNGYKIANPTISARISPEELHSLFVGFGWTPYLVEGDDPRGHASADGGDARGLRHANPFDPGGRARERPLRTTALADDHPAHAQRLDGAEGTRRSSSGRVVARAPDPDPRRRRQPGAPADAGGVDAPLSPGGTVRRGGPACSTAEGARADRRAADERQSPRQRRRAADPAPVARFRRLRRAGEHARCVSSAGHADPRRVPAGRHAGQHGQLPRLRSRRNGVQPPAGHLRGEQEDVARRLSGPRTPTAASSRQTDA